MTNTQRSAIITSVSTVSVAALIVAKMLAFNWVGEKLQSRFGRH